MSPIRVEVDRHRRRGPDRRGPHRPGLVPDPGLHAGGHPGRGQGPGQRRPRGAGGRGGPGQHLPPDAPARAPTSSPPSAACTASPAGTGHTLTDSGGFQVHSLRPTVDDDGVTFASVYDGSPLRLTPESAVEAQGLIGADIQMVLDVCATLPATAEVLRVAVDRTAAWAARARRHHRPAGGQTRGPGPVRHRPGRHRSGPAQGERPSARSSSDFDGYGIGGLSVGEPRPAMLDGAGRHRRPSPGRPAPLPDGCGRPGRADRGGRPGVDQFDCVAPTRMARHGSMLTSAGRLNLRNAVHARDDGPLDPACGCPHLRPLVAGLPAPPAGGGGAHGLAAAQHPQPGLCARTDGRGPPGHRRGTVRRALRRPRPRRLWGALRPSGASPGVGLGYSRTAVPTLDPLPRRSMMAALDAGRRRCSARRPRRRAAAAPTFLIFVVIGGRVLLPHLPAPAAQGQGGRGSRSSTSTSATRCSPPGASSGTSSTSTATG